MSNGQKTLGVEGTKRARRFSTPVGTFIDTGVLVKRPPFTQAAFDDLHMSTDDDKATLGQRLKSKMRCTRQRAWKIFSAYLPIVNVMRYYNFKSNTVTDVLAGITIGILHIPQALAFGNLTSVKMENGLYTSIWPVLLYVIFGTSAHVSMGTSAVICIVTASVVDRQADQFKLANPGLMANLTGNETMTWEDIPEFMDYKEATAMGIAFFTGIILLSMGLLKIGFITAYLSDSFFSAFTSGAGVLIATSQIPALLGIKIQRYGGLFKIIKTYGAIFGAITEVNVCALVTALISAAIILFIKEFVNEKLKNKLPIPIPAELVIVILTTLVSYLMNMEGNFGVDIVSSIPNDIPAPIVPSFDGVGTYIVDCFVLAILIFANTIAMAKICAKRHNYEVDDSQELIAYGMCNFGGSFLRCFPSAVAPPRSMAASAMNTKSTFNGIFSAALLILMVLVMSPLFEPLPKSVLAAIIIVPLKGLFLQLKDSVRFWRVNKIDFVIWFFTLFSTVFLDIDVGLGVGVIVSLITVVFQAQYARGYRLGRTMKDVTLVEHKRYSDSMELSGIKVYRFHSNLFFANAEIFRMSLYRETVNPRKILKFVKKQERKLAKLNAGVMPDNGITSKSYTVNNMEIPSVTINSKASDGTPTNGVSSISGNNSSVIRMNSNGSGKNVVGVDNPVYSGKEEPSSVTSSTLDIPTEYTLSSRQMSVTTITTIESMDIDVDPEDGQELVTEEKIRRMRRIHHVIIDFSTVNYMDISGANVITHIFKEYSHVNIKLLLSNISFDVRQTMQQAGVFDTIPKDNIFVDVLDAIAIAKLESLAPLPEDVLEDFTIEEAAENNYITHVGQ